MNNKNSGRIVSLNLRHGGGSRIAQLTDWLVSKSSSAVIATEWRNNVPGQSLRDRLALDVLNSIVTDAATSQSNTVLVAASRVRHSERITPLNSAAGNLVFASLDGFAIAKQHSQSPLVMVGDLNTGRNDLDIEGRGAPFHCADLFAGLNKTAGLVDLWRARHGDRQDWTWYTSKYGFRVDHAFGNPAFIDQFPNFRCEIDHEPRLTKLTDHSAIIVELE